MCIQLFAAAALLLSGGLSTFAQPAPLSALPPAPFTFQGKWACQGAFRAGKPHEAAFTGDVILGGKWIEMNEVDTVPATGYAGKYLIGFDPEHNRLVEFDANSFAAATYSSSEGWVGGVLTMTSPISENPKAHYALNRFVYSVAGQETFTIDWQISKTAEPQWTTADHLSCKRLL